ncbi:hypothetical protein [uncultured Selenomonas sp.]|uniref:hypothetical protein n=1 Tax=uncultured Selenomonas sp. TaxID=159275 RepID=UPI0025DF9E86|nr:hypothetical protein [uncultured Selenomonas sp.]
MADGRMYGWKQGDTYSEAVLHQLIDTHDVISFDIFDTVLMRSVLDPTDVFEIVEQRAEQHGLHLPDFKFVRLGAEHRILASKRRHSLPGIYDDVRQALDLLPEEADWLKACEWQVEQEVILPRRQVHEWMKAAKTAGKRVVLVSDMYLSTEEIRTLLQKWDITAYDAIYLSGEHGSGKPGTLFDDMKAEQMGMRYLHIGDNPIADGTSAVAHGMDAFLIPSAKTMFASTRGRDCLRAADTLHARCILGRVIARLCNNPFAWQADGTIRVSDARAYAYVFFGPLFASFFSWLVADVRRERYDAVLFAARDGFFLQKLYEWYRARHPELSRSQYFYVSRMACIAASFRTKEEIQKSVQFFRYAGESMGKLMGMEHGVLSVPRVLETSRKLREQLIRYLRKSGLHPEGRYAFFDLSSSGTSQSLLQTIFFRDLTGVYLARSFSPISPYLRPHLRIHHFSEDFPGAKDAEIDLRKPHAFGYEFFCSAPEGSVYHFNADGNPVFLPDQRHPEDWALAEAMQQGVTDFCKEALEGAGPEENSARSVALSLANQRFYIASGKTFAKTCTLYDDANQNYIPLADAF